MSEFIFDTAEHNYLHRFGNEVPGIAAVWTDARQELVVKSWATAFESNPPTREHLAAEMVKAYLVDSDIVCGLDADRVNDLAVLIFDAMRKENLGTQVGIGEVFPFSGQGAPVEEPR